MNVKSSKLKRVTRHRVAFMFVVSGMGIGAWVLFLAVLLSQPDSLNAGNGGQLGPLGSMRVFRFPELAFLALTVAATLLTLSALMFRRFVLKPVRDLSLWAATHCEDGELSQLRHEQLTFDRSLQLLRNAQEQCALQREAERETVANVSTAAARCLDVATGLSQAITVARDARTPVVTSIEALTAAVAHIRSHAENGVEAANEAEHEVTSVVEVVSKAMEGVTGAASEMERGTAAVDKLAEDSKNISGILDIIQQVADQTNLLALNAAIEAARAGEQGRGFAVVADEVRNLSHQTKKAADEIKGQINRVSLGIGESKSILDRGCDNAEVTVVHAMTAQERVASVADTVCRIHESNEAISSATAEQGRFISDVNSGILHANEAFAQCAEMIEQITTDLTSLVPPQES